MRRRTTTSAPADAFCQAIKGLDQGVGHPRCLGTRPKHLSTRGKRRARTPPSCCIPYIGDERLPVGPRLGITSVSYPDTAPKMFLVYLHWYAHCASAAEL